MLEGGAASDVTVGAGRLCLCEYTVAMSEGVQQLSRGALVPHASERRSSGSVLALHSE